MGILTGCGGGGEPQNPAPDKAGDTGVRVADTSTAEYDSFGFRVDKLEVSDHTVGRNESLYLILDGLGFSPQEIYTVSRRAEEHIDFSAFKPGQDYRVYRIPEGEAALDEKGGQPSGGGSDQAQGNRSGYGNTGGDVQGGGSGRSPMGPMMNPPGSDATAGVAGNGIGEVSGPDERVVRLVWQPSMLEYVVIEFGDSLNITRNNLEVERVRARAGGTIETSLYEAVTDQKLSQVLAYKMADVLAWEIDFFNLREGDSFRVYYEDRYVNDSYLGVGEILAVEFVHRGKTYQAYRFQEGPVDGYYDGEGNSVQKALLKAPFRYNQRVSSGFNPNRFHPVLKERRPHNGVDYAAPHGTPVLSTGDGTVVEAGYRGANGNWVKIRHNGTYHTAYLHLSGFASGIRRGATVEQGEVIGYVGATGRVTGTHLHYQLYRNERPVNPLTIDLPSSESVPDTLMGDFARARESLRRQLSGIAKPAGEMTARE